MDESRPPLEHPAVPLSDGVVALRGWRHNDLPAIVHMCSDELSARYTTVPDPYGEDDARQWLSTQREARAGGQSISFAVLELPSDVPVASIGISLEDRGMAEIGYLTDPVARGRGIMPRALQLVCRWAFVDLGLVRVHLTTHLENRASQRVAEKCGFRSEGVLRSYGLQRGERVDLMMWARLRDD